MMSAEGGVTVEPSLVFFYRSLEFIQIFEDKPGIGYF